MAPSPSLIYLEASRAMPLIELPVRSTVIDVTDGRILMSPGSTLTDRDLEQAGEVTDIVAPNLFHLDGVARAVARSPKARVWGPVGAKEKLPTVKWDSVLGVDDWPHEKEAGHFALLGMPKLNESVFLHRASRTLLVTDLAFNITQVRGVGPWLILSLFGTRNRFGISRLFCRMAKDKPAFERSLKEVLALDIDAVVPAHGDIVASDGHRRLREALAERGYAEG